MHEALYTQNLLDLTHSLAGNWLSTLQFPWEALGGIGDWLQEWMQDSHAPDRAEYEEKEPGIWVAHTARIAASATLTAPCIIGPETEVRPGAYLRGNTLIGANCVVGNSSELKNVILFDGVQVPHYNYVGDSILGYRAHMGAGAVTSNVKGDRSLVRVQSGEKRLDTGRKKFGAILGDGAEIGCNAVLNPGTIIGRKAQVYPLVSVRGTVPANYRCKSADCWVENRD